jgi:hypothetical protein
VEKGVVGMEVARAGRSWEKTLNMWVLYDPLHTRGCLKHIQYSRHLALGGLGYTRARDFRWTCNGASST